LFIYLSVIDHFKSRQNIWCTLCTYI